MESDDANRLKDIDGCGSNTASLVSCSICLEPVTVDGDRSFAKLQCGHEFHLDCIGSAFNIKGAMQCPNCRKIEKGQWLYANSCRSFSMDEWAHDEDLYDLSYSETTFGVHWCPFGGLTRISSFDEGEFTSTAYHGLSGQHTIFTEHTDVSSASHPCPYVAYFAQIQSSSSNFSTNVLDGSDYNGHWTGPSVPSEMSNPSSLPALDVHYHNWVHHASPFPASGRINAADQATIASVTRRMPRANSDIPRSGFYIHPFDVGHGSATITGSSVASSMIPPYQGTAARARYSVQALQAYFQQSGNLPTIHTPVISNTRRSNNNSWFAQVGPMASSSDQNRLPSRFNAWEREHLPPYALNPVDRDPGWLPYHQASGVSNTGARTSGFHQRRESVRMPSEN